MLAARTESLQTMAGMFGRTPKLGERLMPLQTGLGEFGRQRENLGEFQSGDILYLKILMDHLPVLLENLTLSVRNEEAARFLYDSFGLPKPEIAALATPVYLDLKEKLNLAHDDVEIHVYQSVASLREMMEQIERSIFTFYAARLEELSKEKEACEKAIEDVQASESRGATEVTNDAALEETLRENLKKAEKELAEVQMCKNSWQGFIVGLNNTIFAAQNGIQLHADIAAPDPEKAL